MPLIRWSYGHMVLWSYVLMTLGQTLFPNVNQRLSSQYICEDRRATSHMYTVSVPQSYHRICGNCTALMVWLLWHSYNVYGEMAQRTLMVRWHNGRWWWDGTTNVDGEMAQPTLMVRWHSQRWWWDGTTNVDGEKAQPTLMVRWHNQRWWWDGTTNVNGEIE